MDLTFSRGKRYGCSTASLDRINNDEGYNINNIQWVHKRINMCKHTYSNSEFIEMCRMVYEHNK